MITQYENIYIQLYIEKKSYREAKGFQGKAINATLR